MQDNLPVPTSAPGPDRLRPSCGCNHIQSERKENVSIAAYYKKELNLHLNLPWVPSQVLSVPTADVHQNLGSVFSYARDELLDTGPGFVTGFTEVVRYLLVHFVNVRVLQSLSQRVVQKNLLVLLGVAKGGEFARAGNAAKNLPEGQGYPQLSLLQRQPVIARLAGR